MAMYLAKSSDVAARVLGKETIIMSTLDSTLFSLNPTGTVIWEAANGRTPLSEIVDDRICASYSVGTEQATQDALEFVQELANHGILILSPEPIPQKEAV